MSKPFEFEPEDFNELAYLVQDHPGDGRIAREKAFSIAQGLLREWLEQSPKVYASLGGFNTAEENEVWLKTPTEHCSHTARLVDIREIEGGEK